jgi:DNA adenine methylase
MEHKITSPPLKYPGGKQPLARRIVAMMPGHTCYCEPYAGGLAVLLAKSPEGISEVVNDLDGRITNFWTVMQRPSLFAEFQRKVSAIAVNRREWGAARNHKHDGYDPIADAAAFFVLVRQSLAGRMDSFSPLSKTRTRRGMNEQASAWLSAIDGLPAVHERLRRVVVENLPAVEVIRREDGPSTMFYCDPPYLHETRTAKEVYGAYEMTRDDHVELLKTLRKIEGKFLISGYRSRLYDRAAEKWGWHRVDFNVANHAASGATKRRMIESVWANFPLKGGAA